MASGIYMIENSINGNVYIGSSKNIGDRVKSHLKDLRGNRHHSIYFQRAFNIYGEENFEFEMLLLCHPDELLYYEQMYLDQRHPEYNISQIAGKVEWTEETRHKLSESHKGKKLSDGQKRKISESNKGKKRPPISDATRLRMSNSQKGRKHSSGYKFSDESKLKMSKSAKARTDKRTMSEDGRKKLSEINRGNKYCLGKVHSSETRNKIAKRLTGNVNSLGKKHSEESKKRQSDSARRQQSKLTPEQRSANTKKGWETRRKNKGSK